MRSSVLFLPVATAPDGSPTRSKAAPEVRPVCCGLGVVASVLSGEQNHSCYGQNSEQGYIDEYAAASFRGPHEQGEPESTTSNRDPA